MTAGFEQDSADGPNQLEWNNDYGATSRVPKSSFITVLSDVVGDENRDDDALIPFGAILDSVDLCAGRTAYRHVEGPVVTVSVEYGKVTRRVQHGDFVRVISRVVEVGSSSVTIETVIWREILGACPAVPPVFEPAMSFQLTFVAILQETGRPYKNVPKLKNLDELARARAERARLVKSTVREIEDGTKSAVSEGAPPVTEPWDRRRDPFHASRKFWTRIDETTVLFSKQYLPRHENFGGVVFGGDLLLLLEKAAVYCARRFTRARHVQCIAIYDVHFMLPVKPRHMLNSTAQIVYVRQYCMEVEVTVDCQQEGADWQRSHVARFSVVTHDACGRMLPILTGLDLSDASDTARQTHERAHSRMEKAFWIPKETPEFPAMLVRTAPQSDG